MGHAALRFHAARACSRASQPVLLGWFVIPHEMQLQKKASVIGEPSIQMASGKMRECNFIGRINLLKKSALIVRFPKIFAVR